MMTKWTWLFIVAGVAQGVPAVAVESIPALHVERLEEFWQQQTAPDVLDVPAAPEITPVEHVVPPELAVQKESASTVIRFLAQGMNSHSSTEVEGQLKKLPGVLDVVADWKPGMVTVFFDGNQVKSGAIYAAVSQMGFYVEPLIEPTLEYADTEN